MDDTVEASLEDPEAVFVKPGQMRYVHQEPQR